MIPRRCQCVSGPMEYTDGYKYQIRKNMRFALPPEFQGIEIETDFIKLETCLLTIRKGYAYNGASGPTFDTKNSMRPTAFHDAMCQLMAEGLLPREFSPLVNELFRELLLQDGMSSFRSGLWHHGVEKHGAYSTIRNKNILVAP